ncbi:hemin uptake protein HemP [Montanilutibacter psychrotolerans]|uniref:Hemin uptake protein HemP n=1 Tax=Montanilutibacter psychrotolerans TaxID=1327343 RepID=A0A3M8SXE6_9GAMM|nr:hemin uptake protein HemP [Lysobacter psychrotolerans]RNF85969.1 hemin uptake protein HemP [Lysobacter psychrotolerans]
MSPRPTLLQLKPRAERAPVSFPLDVNATFESTALLRGTREVLIRHGGEVYRLRHTRNDKLILTK